MFNKIITLTLFFTLSFSTVFAQIEIQWRGENRSGFYPSENLLSEWPEAGPDLLLHVDSLGESYSSVVVKNEVMYTTGISDTTEILTAIDMNGKILWNTVYGKAWDKSYRNARCTPTVEDDKAYVISGNGYLACIDLQNGKLQWQIDGYTNFKGEAGRWGVAESPLLVGNLMIYTPCGEKTTMVALDKNTGETIWMSESLGELGSYCSPVLVEKEGLQIIVTVTSKYVLGVNAENGNFIWKYNYGEVETPMMGSDINPVTPLVVGNEIFITSGYNHVAVMLEMSKDYKSVSLKWSSELLDVHHGGVVVVDGYIYGSNYTSIRKGNWVCLKWEDGQAMYEQEWNTKGQIIATDAYLICYDERNGNVALVKTNPAEFRIQSQFKVEQGKGPHWSHPTIYNDKLFIRHGKDLMVYQIGHSN